MGSVRGRTHFSVTAGSFHDTDTAKYTAEDYRFTKKGNNLYVIELGRPAREASLPALGTDDLNRNKKVAHIELLGSNEKINFQQDESVTHSVSTECSGRVCLHFSNLRTTGAVGSELPSLSERDGTIAHSFGGRLLPSGPTIRLRCRWEPESAS